MKRKNLFGFATILISTLLLSFSPQKTYSQTYQLPNGNFEVWDGGEDDEPTNWNSYTSAKCDLTGLAALGCGTVTAKRHERSTDIHPGATGSYSCKIYAVSILGIIANGTVTTGRIRAGSTSANSDENYNITLRNDNSFNQPLNAKPDSITFWAKFVAASATSNACCHAYIHDDYNFIDPMGADENNYQHIVGSAMKDFSRGNQTWVRYSVPFTYGFSATTPKYLLLTVSTNAIPGGGSANDCLYIDDVALVYNSRLSDLQVNGTSIPNFNPNITDYYINVDCDSENTISATTESSNASITISQANETSQIATVRVSNGDQQSTYTVHYNKATTRDVEDEICKGNSYNQNGFVIPTQNAAGTYNFSKLIYESEACDTLVELTLTVRDSYIYSQDLQICESATYDFYGQAIAEAGTYRKVFTSQYGCDSTFILNMTIGDFYQSNISAIICEGEVYEDNGFNREAAGTYTMTYTAINNCDSLVVLNLEVNLNNSIELFDSVYIGEPYEKNGFDIEKNTQEGDFTYISELTNTSGCDSIVTLNLKVLPQPIAPEDPEFVLFEIYPNPTVNGKITITANYEFTDDSYDYKIYNIKGELMSVGILSQKETSINVENYSKGYYFLKVYLPENKKGKKKAINFIVE